MNRRAFGRHLAHVVIAIPAAKWLAALSGCDDQENATVNPADFAQPRDLSTPGAPVDMAGQAPVDMATQQPADMAMAPMSITYTSTVSASQGNHTHQVTLEVSLFSNPPSDGIMRATTINNGHDHSVTLTMAELQTIGGGGTVTKTTSLNSEHTHDFTFVNHA